MIRECFKRVADKDVIVRQIDEQGLKVNYVVINEETARDLSNLETIYPKRGYFAEFCGVPIAICNKLKYGEFELV